jgi:four helix bundle protein
MPIVRDFRDLTVWQRSVDFAVEVYRLTRVFPKDERFSLTQQVRRAAVSVSSNIAEGSGRSSLKDRRNFYGMARGSLKEAESLLIVGQRLDFIAESDCESAFAYAAETGRMLTKLRQNLRGR